MKVDREAAILVGLVRPGDPRLFEPALEELSRLASTAGAEVVGRIVQKRDSPDPATYLGKGKVSEVAEEAEAFDAGLVIFDDDLTPAQSRNLEKILGRRVVDRSELILDIFATRARTRQARVQVELAQLQYLRPRLRRMWTHLSRIEGGVGARGPIGSRGPGEKQLELDRRAINRRIHALSKQLSEFERQHDVKASGRRAFFSVSLVGYTNAGKSTLLERLTGADVLVEDRLFATLDTTTRAWSLPGGKRLFLSDTVGFIRGLPHHLVASFHATLKEAREADLLLHVVDASNPDGAAHTDTVEKVLEEVGASEVPVITVLNKVDRVKERLSLELIRPARGRSVVISAATGEGIPDLEREVLEVIEANQVVIEMIAHAGDGKLLSYLAEKGEILSREYLESEQVRIVARLLPRDAEGLPGSREDRSGG